MKTSEFHFDYPEELVAQVPLAERDSARLLFWDPVAGQPRDRIFFRAAEIISANIATEPILVGRVCFF